MPGLVPGIHVFAGPKARKTWMAGTKTIGSVPPFHLLSHLVVIYSKPKAKSPKRIGERRGSALLDRIFYLLIIGGGINGCGIALDATGRRNTVFLCEMNDLARATSSWSTKLWHYGLRSLQYQCS